MLLSASASWKVQTAMRARSPHRHIFVILLIAGACCAIALFLGWGGQNPGTGGGVRGIPGEMELLRAFEKAAGESPLFSALVYSFLLVLALGIVFDIGVAWRMIRRRFRWPHRLAGVSWGAADVARVALVFLAALCVLHALYPLCGRWPGGISEISFSLIIQFLAEVAALWFMCALIPSGARGALRSIGLRAGDTPGQIAQGVKAYVGFLPVLLLLARITEIIASHFGIALESQEQIVFFFADLSLPSLIFLVLFVAFLGPCIEEVFFRGFAYQALRRHLTQWPSILLTSLLFSALHANAAVFLPIMGLGVLLACMFERSGSLVPSITIHVCQNSLAVTAALLLRSFSRG